MRANWEHFHHQADIGVRGRGESLDEAFQQAAIGLTAVVAIPGKVMASDPVEVECSAPDLDMLLVDWLNTVIYEMATRAMLFSRFDVCVMPPRLRARLWGERISSRKHKPVVEVKAATYYDVKVVLEPDGTWLAQCVVDV